MAEQRIDPWLADIFRQPKKYGLPERGRETSSPTQASPSIDSPAPSIILVEASLPPSEIPDIPSSLPSTEGSVPFAVLTPSPASPPKRKHSTRTIDDQADDKGARPVIPLPGPPPLSTHPLAPVYAAYDAVYQDRTLFGAPNRVDIILQRTIDAARAAGFQVENFDQDIYPLLQPWIMAGGEPKGTARWMPVLLQLAQRFQHLPIEQASAALCRAAQEELKLPVSSRHCEELWRDLQHDGESPI